MATIRDLKKKYSKEKVLQEYKIFQMTSSYHKKIFVRSYRKREVTKNQLYRLVFSYHLYCCTPYIPDIGMLVRVFADDPEDLGSIPGRVIPKTQKMVLDASLFNTQHYKGTVQG